MSSDGMTHLPAHPASLELLGPPAALSATPTPMGLIKALRRRWPLALACAIVLGFSAAVTGWFLMPPGSYTARTTLRVPANPSFLANVGPAMNLQDHQRLQVAMVKSRVVLNSALKDPNVASLSILTEKEQQVEWLERELQADFNTAPEVLRISLSGDRPAELIKLVDAIRNAYGREILDKEVGDRYDRLTKMRGQREKWDNKLATSREERKKFETVPGARDANMRAMAMLFTQQKHNWIQQELLQTQAETRRATFDLAALAASREGGTAVLAPETLVEEQLQADPSVKAVMTRIPQLRSDIDEAIAVVVPGKEVPKIGQLRRELADKEKVLAELRKKLLPRITEEVRRHVQNNVASAERELKLRLVVLQKQETALVAQVDQVRNELQKLAENAGHLEALKEDMSHIEELRKWLAKMEQELEMEIGVPQPRFTLLEEGLAVRPPESKRRLMAAGGAGLAAMVLVMLSFAVVEFRGRRVGTPEEMTVGLGLPVVATIPDNREKPKGGPHEKNEMPVLNEAIDTFRTMLLKAGEHETMRVVLITSAQSGEGKTSLSTQLAASFAQVGHATLLIDGDLRNPLAHRIFDLPRGPGLCNLLRDEASIDDVIRATAINRLWMMTAGEWDGGATRALAQDSTRCLIEKLRKRFDYIIIDSSPVLPVVDPLLLGHCADGAVISVLREVSRMPLVYAAYQRLAAGGVRILGAVMSGVRGEQYCSYYPYLDRNAGD